MRGCVAVLLLLFYSCDGVGTPRAPEKNYVAELSWSFPTEEGRHTQPLMDGESFYFSIKDSLAAARTTDGRRLWTTPTQFEVNQYIFDDDTTIYLTNCAKILAVNKSDGSTKWMKYISQAASLSNPSSNQGQIACANKFGIYLIEKSDGSRRFFETPVSEQTDIVGRTQTVALTDDNMICSGNWYLASDRSSSIVYCINSSDGSVLWEIYYPAESYVDVDGKSYYKDMKTVGAVVWKDIVIFGVGRFLDGRNRFTGELIWRHEMKGEGNPQVDPRLGDDLDVPPVVIGDTLYAGTGQGTVFSLDPATGNRHWKIETNLWFLSQFEKRGDDLFFINGPFYAVDANTGRIRWAGSPPSKFNPACFFSTPKAAGDIIINVGCHRVYGMTFE